TAQTLSEVSGGPERAEALLAMGKLLVQAKKLGAAIQPLASAVALVGLEPPDAALELKKVLEAEGGNSAGWAGYAKALETYCSESKAGSHQARIYAEWGYVLAEKQKDLNAAVKALKQGLSRNESSVDLRRELV